MANTQYYCSQLVETSLPISILPPGVKALSWLCLEVIVRQAVAASMLPSPSLPYKQIKMATEALANSQLRPSIKTRQFIAK